MDASHGPVRGEPAGPADTHLSSETIEGGLGLPEHFIVFVVTIPSLCPTDAVVLLTQLREVLSAVYATLIERVTFLIADLQMQAISKVDGHVVYLVAAVSFFRGRWEDGEPHSPQELPISRIGLGQAQLDATAGSTSLANL